MGLNGLILKFNKKLTKIVDNAYRMVYNGSRIKVGQALKLLTHKGIGGIYEDY